EQKDDSIPLDDPASVAVALDVARKGTVLLKNTDNLLPLDAEKNSHLAVVGFHAAQTPTCAGGSAYTPPFHQTNILDAIKDLGGENLEITHHQGVHPYRYEEAYAKSEFFTPDGKEGLVGEYFANRDLEGEPVLSRVDPRINFSWWQDKTIGPGVDRHNFSARWKGIIRPTKSGRHALYLRCNSAIGRVWLDGKLLIDMEKDKRIGNGGTLTAFGELTAGQDHTLVVDYRMLMDWTGAFMGWEHEDDISIDTTDAIAAAREADVALVCTGFTKESEGEGWDRTFGLAPQQEQLIRDIAAVNENTIVVVLAGGGIDMASWLGDVKGLLYMWYPGQEGSHALAEIIFGLVNPSAKLPITIERRLEDRSSTNCYHDDDGDKRVQLADGIFGGYRHFDRENIEPLFPFGFGLGYTTFEYSDLQLSAGQISESDTLNVSFTIENTGSRSGEEVAQVYIGDVESSHPRPIKELKAFEKVELQPGQSQRVEISITTRDLEYFDPDKKMWTAESGEFRIYVGASAADIRLEDGFELGNGK
ncbi:MAG TPA: beta-glucosidase, partial [Phycisphaerae bacterium]|nr:beta-glucosidase [Phycisphaerae bacterium]